MRNRKDGFGVTELILALVLICVIAFGGYYVWNKHQNKNADSNNTSTSASTNKAGVTEILPQTTFASGLGKWYEEIWYKPASSGGEVTTGAGGVTFNGVQPNSRSGIMITLNKDVSNFKKVTISAKGIASEQTLSGTGLNGREAPVAIAVAYKATDGVEHNLLGENPSAAGQMFWRGFYYLNPSGDSVTTNGVKVTKDKPFSFTFDLMTLNPKPKTIEFVSLEGAGWKTREGSISQLSITGE